jgi:(2Fe-2S) ferredoxin
VVAVNEHWHELVTPEAAERLVDDLRARGPAALSGCHLCVEK